MRWLELLVTVIIGAGIVAVAGAVVGALIDLYFHRGRS